MFGFFRWFRNLFRRRRGDNWRGFDAIDDIRTDSPEEWRRMNER